MLISWKKIDVYVTFFIKVKLSILNYTKKLASLSVKSVTGWKSDGLKINCISRGSGYENFCFLMTVMTVASQLPARGFKNSFIFRHVSEWFFFLTTLSLRVDYTLSKILYLNPNGKRADRGLQLSEKQIFLS